MKKLNAICIIAEAVTKNPEKHIKHLLNNKKLTIFVHDMILVALWRDELLPRLLAANKKRPKAKTERGKEPPTFCGTTAVTVLKHALYCGRVLRATIDFEDVFIKLAVSNAFDLIEYSVKALQKFV